MQHTVNKSVLKKEVVFLEGLGSVVRNDCLCVR